MNAKQKQVVYKTKVLLSFLNGAARKRELIAAGKQRDSLLRALIPLYITQSAGPLEGAVTSGVTQRFWRANGVKVQATVMAKALREHVGYARRSKNGLFITPNGVKYVVAALKS